MNKTKLKISIPLVIRRMTQLLAFILIPGLFVSAFSAFKDIFSALIQGTFSISALSVQFILLLTVIPITVLMGRFFCGYLCAFGSMGDVLWFISNKIHKRTLRVSERTDGILKKLKYILLFLVVALGWTGLISLSSTANPWTVFGMYFAFAGWPSAAYLLSIGAALLVLIMIGSFFIERFFCRYLCPLGAIYSILSLPRLFRIKKPRTSCGDCTLCTKKCAMGIPLNQADQVTSGECINCFQCVEACPRHNVKANPTPALATAFATAAIAGLYFVGNLPENALTPAQTSVSANTLFQLSIDTGAFADGEYTGTGTGFRGDTTVSVTVSGGVITSVTVVSYRDDAKYFSRAKSSVISAIISQQSVDVSTVSGATFSCNGIIEAVADALSIDYTNPNSTLPKHGHSI